MRSRIKIVQKLNFGKWEWNESLWWGAQDSGTDVIRWRKPFRSVISRRDSIITLTGLSHLFSILFLFLIFNFIFIFIFNFRNLRGALGIFGR